MPRGVANPCRIVEWAGNCSGRIRGDSVSRLTLQARGGEDPPRHESDYIMTRAPGPVDAVTAFNVPKAPGRRLLDLLPVDVHQPPGAPRVDRPVFPSPL